MRGMGSGRWEDAGMDERLTVAEAADRLGITKEAVRKRIHRGTLRADKAADGTVLVYTPPSGTVGGTPPGAARDELVDELRDRIAYLERQVAEERRANDENRRLLLAALERIPPQLEAPQEQPPDAPGTPRAAKEQPGRV